MGTAIFVYLDKNNLHKVDGRKVTTNKINKVIYFLSNLHQYSFHPKLNLNNDLQKQFGFILVVNKFLHFPMANKQRMARKVWMKHFPWKCLFKVFLTLASQKE
uniref:Uncharacterized protein n=1 Tax=Tetranychus urticae TaxID=32264 RepID=T1JUQ9_TETUR